MPLINTALLAASASAGGSPSVYTLTLDALLTRFAEYTGAAASIRFKLTNGTWTTDYIYLDSSNGSGNANGTIVSAADLATRIDTALEAATGNSNLVTVSGSDSEAGDRYDFTITFDISLGAVPLSFTANQWYPTIALVETVDTEGVSDDPGSPAVVRIDAVSDGSSNLILEAVGYTHSVAAALFDSAVAPSGWSLTDGGVGQAFIVYTKNTTGVVSEGSSSNNGVFTYTHVANGSDSVTGSPEIHTITPQPVNPTGGTWKPGQGGSAISYNNDTDIAANAQNPGWSSPTKTSGSHIGAGAVQITNGVNGDVSGLSPSNVDLTAPEITHSITPA